MLVLIVIVVVAVILGLVLLYAKRKGKSLTAEPMYAGMAAGGIAGAIIGVLLVEFAGFEYPFAAILWMLGMAAGLIIGRVYKKRLGNN